MRVDNPYEDQYIFRFAKENDIDVWLGNLENVCKFFLIFGAGTLFYSSNLCYHLARL